MIPLDAALLQWPAMATTIVAAWLVGSQRPGRRNLGFWLYLASNALWVGWGLHDHAWALIALQAFLAITNVRGMAKTSTSDRAPSGASPS